MVCKKKSKLTGFEEKVIVTCLAEDVKIQDNCRQNEGGHPPPSVFGTLKMNDLELWI